MNTDKMALDSIRRAVSEWLADQNSEATAVLGQIAAVLIDPTAGEKVIRIERDGERQVSTSDLLDSLERAIAEAEHKPGEWAACPNQMGGIATKMADTLAFMHSSAWGSFSYKRDAWLAIAAVNALPELVERLRRAEQGKHPSAHDVDQLQADLQAANLEIQRLQLLSQEANDPNSSLNQKARCWESIVCLLDEVAPGWTKEQDSLRSLAIKTIRQLATAKAFDDGEARMDPIGQNGPTGEHYDELVEEAIAQGGKPISPVEQTLVTPWHSAPEWANVLLAGRNGLLVWAASFTDLARAQLARPHQWIKEIGSIKLGPLHGWKVVATRPGHAEQRDNAPE